MSLSIQGLIAAKVFRNCDYSIRTDLEVVIWRSSVLYSAQLNPLSKIIRPHKWTATLLSGVVVLALTGNALAAALCPHMSGRQCCVKAVTAQLGQSASIEHDHNHHAEMSDMDMSDETMEMSDAQIGDANVSPADAENDLASNATRPGGDQKTLEAVTEPNQPCSHCMLHSQTSPNYSLRAAIESSPSYQIIAEVPLELSILVSPPPRFVEVHDHGPPGSLAPLYVLVGSFRI